MKLQAVVAKAENSTLQHSPKKKHAHDAMYMCVYIDARIYIYIYIYIHVYVYIYMHTHTHVCPWPPPSTQNEKARSLAR